MSTLKKIGDLIFDYMVISLLLTISLLLVIPLIPIFIGVINYFEKSSDDRQLKDIFTSLKGNMKIITKVTIFELLVITLSVLDIIYFNTGERSNIFITLIGFVMLIYAVIVLVNSPILVLHMKLNLRQLLFNSITLIFGKWYLSLVTILTTIGAIVLSLYFPYYLPFALYFIALMVEEMTKKNFLILKARALKTTVENLSKKHDDYYDILMNKEN